MIYQIYRHSPNQHGWPISLVIRDEENNLIHGFVLSSEPTREDQERYISQLADMTKWEVVDQ